MDLDSEYQDDRKCLIRVECFCHSRYLFLIVFTLVGFVEKWLVLTHHLRLPAPCHCIPRGCNLERYLVSPTRHVRQPWNWQTSLMVSLNMIESARLP